MCAVLVRVKYFVISTHPVAIMCVEQVPGRLDSAKTMVASIAYN